LNFSFSFHFVYENYGIFIIIVVFVMKINLFSSTKIFVFIVIDENNIFVVIDENNTGKKVSKLISISVCSGELNTTALKESL